MTRKAHTTTIEIGIGVCTFDVRPQDADAAIQIFPAGTFDAPRGAMAGKGPWRMDAAIAARLLDRLAGRSNPLVVDYEHQTLRSADNGRPAPAAGWLDPRRFEWREGQGLFALSPEWTAAARGHIEAREYRYLSPVFTYDPATGEVLDLLHLALTNAPAIDGMDEVRAAATAQYHHSHQEQESAMNELLQLFGLAPDASEAEAVAALTQLQQEVADLRQQLADKEETIAAAKAAPDPAKFVPVAAVTELQGELAALKAQITGAEVERIVTAALAQGKLLPAMEEWARDLGNKDLPALEAYLEQAQPVAALTGTQTGGQAPADDGQAGPLSEEERWAAAQLGISEADFAAAKQA